MWARRAQAGRVQAEQGLRCLAGAAARLAPAEAAGAEGAHLGVGEAGSRRRARTPTSWPAPCPAGNRGSLSLLRYPGSICCFLQTDPEN